MPTIQPLSHKKMEKILSFLSRAGATPMTEFKKGSTTTIDGNKIYIFEDGCRLIVIQREKLVYPFIETLNCVEINGSVEVDRGAAEAVLRGADLMAPGVKSHRNLVKNRLVLITFQGTPIAIGQALVDSSEVRERGKVVENLHYKGDKLWRMVRSL